MKTLIIIYTTIDSLNHRLFKYYNKILALRFGFRLRMHFEKKKDVLSIYSESMKILEKALIVI